MLQKALTLIHDWRNSLAKEGLWVAICHSAETGDFVKVREAARKLDPERGGCAEMLINLAYAKNLPALSAVLSAGVRPDILGNDDDTILHRLADFQEAIVDRLLESTQHVDIRDRQGFTPLMRAASIHQHHGGSFIWKNSKVDSRVAKRVSLVEKIMRLGACLDLQNEKGRTALMLALDDPPIVRFLIESGADLDMQDTDGLTALHWCLIPRDNGSGRQASAQLLLQAGARTDVKDKHGRTSVDWVRGLDNIDMMELFDACIASRRALDLLNNDTGIGLRPL